MPFTAKLFTKSDINDIIYQSIFLYLKKSDVFCKINMNKYDRSGHFEYKECIEWTRKR